MPSRMHWRVRTPPSARSVSGAGRRGLTERLLRFSALHRTYWGDDDTAQTFLDEIVRRVYGEDAMLG